MSAYRSLASSAARGTLQLLRTARTTHRQRPTNLHVAFPPILRTGNTVNTRPFSTIPTAESPPAGFSYPGPRKLTQVVKLQLLTKHGAPKVKEIWDTYHRDHKTAVGDVLSGEEYSLLKGRSERCRHFVLPVPRETGYFTLLVQFQGKQCFMTYLEDYKSNAAGAQPWLTVTLFDELLETKNLVLLRGEVTNMLTKPEAKVLVELVKAYYLGQGKTYDTVVAFNEASEKFDFNKVLRTAGIGS